VNASAHFTYDHTYFEAFYSDWLVYRSRWRRFATPFAVAVTGAGAAIFFMMPQQRAFGVFVLVFGLYLLYVAVTYRKRWISDRVNNLQADRMVELIFRGEEIYMETPNSSSRFHVAALAEVVATPNGIFLIPQSGVSVFVPRASIEPIDAFSPLVESLTRAIQKAKTTDS